MRKFKSNVRSVLNKFVSAQRFNDSRAYAIYLAICHPSHFKMKSAELRFYRQILENRRGLIFDVGANEGHKTAVFLRVADRIVCLEPSPAAASVLKERFAHDPRVTIIAMGVADRIGTAELNVLDDSHCYDTFSSKWISALNGSTHWRPNKVIRQTVNVPITTLDSLIASHGIPNYIKIDVEGYELQVLCGLSTKVPLISAECHLPEFAQETKEMIERLSKLSPKGVYNFAVTEPPSALCLPCWLGRDEMVQVVDSGRYGFIELYFPKFSGLAWPPSSVCGLSDIP